MDPVIQITQLSNRLEDATSGERIAAIEALRSLARVHPTLVGEHAIPKLIEILKMEP